MPARSFRKEMQLAWEPLKMVVARCPVNHAPNFRMATIELCNLDMINDYYIPLVLFYDVVQADHAPSSHNSQLVHQCSAPLHRNGVHDDPVSRLHHALQELLLHHPSAAGVLVHSKTDGRLEVRYPLPGNCCSSLNSADPCHHQAYECTCNLLHGRPASSMDIDYITASKPRSESFHGSNGDSSGFKYGVPFHVAHANVSLSELGDVSDPQPFLDLLFPNIEPAQGHGGSHGDPRVIMAFQVTTFKCGSFALAHTCNHVYADGYTAATFLQNLCSIARGAGLANPSRFCQSRRVALSAREPPSPAIHSSFITAEKHGSKALLKPIHYGRTTQFVFPLDAIEALRESVSQPDKSKTCSRIQALMALLWTASAKVRLQVHGLGMSEEMTLRFPINVRTRGIPNLNAEYLGNAVFQCTVRGTLGELCESPLAYVVEKIKSSVKCLDLQESLQSMIDEVELKLRDGLVPFIEEGCLGMPSLVGLPFYDTDCGWGRPIYVGVPSQQMSNRCAILEHPSARAWNVFAVFLSVEECACFEDVIANYINYKK